jgi:hypothetical protein
MLKYETIYEVSGARRRLEKGRDRYSYRYDGRTRDNDQLSLFTFETPALADSAHNLDFLLAQARGHDQRYVVLTDNKVQIAGEHDIERVADAIAPRAWLKDFAEWLEYNQGHGAPTVDDARHGSMVTLQSWRHCFCLKEHQGVYDVTTGRRMTRREDIIRAFWSLGFATWRGRPYSIARLRWSGEREELEELTALASRYWNSQSRSDVAKKIASAYRSINRYAAWPGAW